MPIRGSASLCEVRPLYKSPRRPKFMDQFPFVIASCTYRDSSLTSEWPLNGNRLPPRVRSKGARVVQGAAMGFPLESTQEFPFASVSEERNVGSTMPKRLFSLRKVCWYVTPPFTL